MAGGAETSHIAALPAIARQRRATAWHFVGFGRDDEQLMGRCRASFFSN
ncbi:hypothetical protein [Brucella pseudogrignonensis]